MPKAKYEGIYHSIKKRIEAQDYPYQSLLPSENTLIEEYACSRNTVRRALAELGDVTKLIIAQRITSVMDADMIVILDDGKVHAVGTHKELLANDTIYQEIYASQMKGDDADGKGIQR